MTISNYLYAIRQNCQLFINDVSKAQGKPTRKASPLISGKPTIHAWALGFYLSRKPLDR